MKTGPRPPAPGPRRCYNLRVRKQAGIYVHIPFCERKCTYCNFNTTDFFEGLAARYVEAVSREIAYWGRRLAERDACGRVIIDTIFFGGGTPSIIEAGQLGTLIQACREAFEVTPDAEITIEINPGTFSPEKFARWRKEGINRASIGVQSFIDRELVALSRTHTSRDARRTILKLREAGFENISLDLIAGLPDQTLTDWEFNLSEALKLDPEHLSLYLLEVKEGTQLFAQIKRGQRPRPDDDLAAEMYRMISAATRASGYEHYEISNFAVIAGNRKSSLASYRSKHNMKYWTGAPYYGVGCGAHSYDARSRRVNVLKTETYIDRIAAHNHAIGEEHHLSKEDRAAEALFMGLRLTEGISLIGFLSEYGINIRERYADELLRLEEAGLIEFSDDHMRLTGRGLLLSNEVFQVFV